LTKPYLERLTGEHRLDSFDCGVPALNDWLRKHARQAESTDSCFTFVAQVDREVVGYRSLVVGSIERETAPPELTNRMPRYPVPVVLIARLAVDLRYQGQALGKGLLRDALKQSVRVAEIVAVKAVVVDAKDGAAPFYEAFGFTKFPGHEDRLYVTLASLRSVFRDAL